MRLFLGDCLEVMRQMEADSVDLIAVDPPYFKVKGQWWDRQWADPAAFLDWIGDLCQEWQRLLKPNGSLYNFASPKMAARVEVEMGKWFEVLNRIRWLKNAGWHKKAVPENLRTYLSPWEEIIFAEHYGADSTAKGESGYGAKCDELHGFVFEPLRAYLEGERRRAGIDKIDCNVACGFSASAGGMASRHYFSRSQWQLPTAQHYASLQRLFNTQGHRPAPPYDDYHDAPRSRFEQDGRDIGEYLRADYEDLRADYEDLRRPFFATSKRPYTDTWEFPTVSHYPGKHPCEKPLELMRHIILTSSRPGDTVLDCCMGSGTTGMAAVNEGREFIGIEIDPEYFEIAKRRIQHAIDMKEPVQLELIS